MKSYTHFTLSERNCLQQFLSEGKGVREIGRLMSRSASSISREKKETVKIKRGTMRGGQRHFTYTEERSV